MQQRGRWRRRYRRPLLAGGDYTLVYAHNFAGAGSLTPGIGPAISFARTGTATYFDSSGVLQTAATGVERFDHSYDGSNWNSIGLLVEGASTNRALWNRDFTNAAWVASNVTPVKDATGVDGSANAASTLTAGAANGTILQTVSIASAERAFSVYVKRKTGTGDIDITDNNGANWTTLTGLSSTEWTRYYITRTQSNPVFGFRIVTSGDEIEADYAGLEDGAEPTSPIATTTVAVARNAETASADISSIVNTAMTALFEGTTGYGAGVLMQLDDGTENERVRVERNGSNQIVVTVTDGGVEQAAITMSAVADLTVFKVAVAWNTNDIAVSLNGGAASTDTLATIPTVDTVRIGTDTANDEMNAWAASARLWDVRKTNAFLQAVTYSQTYGFTTEFSGEFDA